MGARINRFKESTDEAEASLFLDPLAAISNASTGHEDKYLTEAIENGEAFLAKIDGGEN